VSRPVQRGVALRVQLAGVSLAEPADEAVGSPSRAVIFPAPGALGPRNEHRATHLFVIGVVAALLASCVERSAEPMEGRKCTGVEQTANWRTEKDGCSFCPSLMAYNANLTDCYASPEGADGGTMWSCHYDFRTCADASRWANDKNDGGASNCQLQETGACLEVNHGDGYCCALRAQALKDDAGCLEPVSGIHGTFACVVSDTSCEPSGLNTCFQDQATPPRTLVFSGPLRQSMRSDFGLVPCDNAVAAAVSSLSQCE
jgi:hypothetical protein